MTYKPIICITLGTRPEAIKLAPVIQRFQTCEQLLAMIRAGFVQRVSVTL
ncbi:MAG: hypothetical protein RIB93_24060 [Coleofasciculus sp. D1-CHI-01]